MSDYMAKVYADPVLIDHGDAVHYKPENAIKDADLGYEGELQDTLDNRLQFSDYADVDETADYAWTGTHTFDEISYSDTYWDDLRVSVNATDVVGSNPPIYAFVLNDGNGAPVAAGLSLIGQTASGYANAPDASAYPLDADHSWSMWIKPDITISDKKYLRKVGVFEIKHKGGNLEVKYGATKDKTTNELNINAWNHIVVTHEDANDTVSVYINSILGAQFVVAGLSTNSANIDINEDGKTDFSIDELCLFDTVLSQADVTADYNSGFGVSKTGGTSDVIGLWKFDDGSGSQADDSHATNNHFTISGVEDTDFSWIDGIVGSTSIGSRGVATRAFAAGVTQELQFSVQMPHKWKSGTSLYPHIHWIPLAAGSGDVRWGLEFTWSSINEVYGNTTIIASATIIAGSMVLNHHNLTCLPTMVGTGKTLSSMLLCRVFRHGEHVDDTFNGPAGLLEIDFHYEIDSPGSRQEFVK